MPCHSQGSSLEMKLSRQSFADIDFLAGCCALAWAGCVAGLDLVRLAALIDPYVACLFALAALARWVVTVRGSENG